MLVASGLAFFGTTPSRNVSIYLGSVGCIARRPLNSGWCYSYGIAYIYKQLMEI